MPSLFPHLQAEIDKWAFDAYHGERPISKKWINEQVRRPSNLDFYRVKKEEAQLTESTRHCFAYDLIIKALIADTISKDNGWMYIGGGNRHLHVHRDWATPEQWQTNWRLRYQAKREDERALELAAEQFRAAMAERDILVTIVRDASGRATDVQWQKALAKAA